MCLSHKLVRQEQIFKIHTKSVISFQKSTNWLGSTTCVKWMSRGEVVVVTVSNPVVLNLFPMWHIWRMASTYATHFREKYKHFFWQKYISINETLLLLLKTWIQRVYRWVMINTNSAQDSSMWTCRTLVPLLPNISWKLYCAAVNIDHFNI